MKYIILSCLLLLISCQKETCKTCTTVYLLPEKEPIVYTTIACGDMIEVLDGRMESVTDSLGRLYFIMTTCK